MSAIISSDPEIEAVNRGGLILSSNELDWRAHSITVSARRTASHTSSAVIFLDHGTVQ